MILRISSSPLRFRDSKLPELLRGVRSEKFDGCYAGLMTESRILPCLSGPARSHYFMENLIALKILLNLYAFPYFRPSSRNKL